jgi:hypothetical protein
VAITGSYKNEWNGKAKINKPYYYYRCIWGLVIFSGIDWWPLEVKFC